MGVETGVYSDFEKKKKEKSDKQRKLEAKIFLEQKKKKAEIKETRESDEILSKLENMLEEGDLSEKDMNIIKKVVENSDINENEVEDIIKKIEEIE